MYLSQRTLAVGAILLCMLFTAAISEAGTIRSPVAAPVNTGGEFGATTDIGNTFDQSGLSSGFTSGVDDFDTYIATNPMHTPSFEDNEWFTPEGVNSATVIYDLGAEYSILRLALWNEDAAGIETMDVSTSNDVSFTTSTSVGSFNPFDNPAVIDYPAEVFDLMDSNARYVRLEVTGPNTGSSFNGISMGEIAFDTAAPSAVVPEPSSLVLCGFGVLGFIGRCLRRKS